MKAIAVLPGRPGSVHLAELARPSVSDVPEGRGVLVKVLRVGVDGTDREILGMRSRGLGCFFPNGLGFRFGGEDGDGAGGAIGLLGFAGSGLRGAGLGPGAGFRRPGAARLGRPGLRRGGGARFGARVGGFWGFGFAPPLDPAG